MNKPIHCSPPPKKKKREINLNLVKKHEKMQFFWGCKIKNQGLISV